MTISNPIINLLARPLAKPFLLFFVLYFVVLVSGCVRIDIGDSVKQPSLSNQLIDLLAAKENGIVTDKEFKLLKKKLLDSF